MFELFCFYPRVYDPHSNFDDIHDDLTPHVGSVYDQKKLFEQERRNRPWTLVPNHNNKRSNRKSRAYIFQ